MPSDDGCQECGQQSHEQVGAVGAAGQGQGGDSQQGPGDDQYLEVEATPGQVMPGYEGECYDEYSAQSRCCRHQRNRRVRGRSRAEDAKAQGKP